MTDDYNNQNYYDGDYDNQNYYHGDYENENNTLISNGDNYKLGSTICFISFTVYCVFKYCIKEKIRIIINKDLKKVLIEDSNLECSICLNNFSNDNKGYQIKCEHIFHKDCIEEWMERSKTCPICRINI